MKCHVQQKPSLDRRKSLSGVDGVDFVHCRICGDRRRVISARHLSKHDITRDEYIEEFELSSDQLIATDFRRLQSSRPRYRPLNKRTWIAAIRKSHRRDDKLSASLLQHGSPDLYSQGVWLFGNWDDALQAAGLSPEVVRSHRVWDARKVVEGIRRLRAERQQLNAHHMMKAHPRLFQAALRHYGKWGEALKAAGLNAATLTNRTARRNLAKALRQAHARGALPRTLRMQAELYFGSLRNALRGT